ncbi:family 20 glycosylhydrolase [Streptomyces sp. KAI-26]|uniref:beta-N-acetylhexosaminidase n=1 Tax=Streptomyces cavourensis TaxID=67258 RepID=A0AAD0VCU4_9ACTN|nr:MULTISPECIES: family 20 glycosylhydrolase [Streptomyces]NUW20710.1 family 20 glycosylhydrolase [Streptomyces roseoviolaceus]AXI69998.1 beta-N-acetylhexosaminidase [Streptomyces cavourensis]NUV39235.1 family 20 glycosylhydrolase [Streptomyces sp. CAI-24]NUV86279.1 family 20 glycosylhydrolase [Streptomyces sp. KAI-26]WAE64441.1 family 20 glycosylhydrolase [Streptomyces cavourensis]
MNAVIPEPRTATPATGQAPGPRTAGPWRVHPADPALTGVAATVQALLEPHFGSRLLPLGSAHRTDVPTLTLALGDGADGSPAPIGVAPDGADRPVDESYRLTVGADGILCRAATPAGVFRAATTALQLLVTSGDRVPRQELADAPRHAWRGLLLDPARGHLTPGEVKQVIDLAALYKLNVLHLHLTDNEGWRLEIPAIPELTAPASDGTPRAFYTTDDYRGLQAYAAERFVTVVPEIDLPGHCATLREALPGLPDAPVPEWLEGRFPFVAPLDLTDRATREAVAAILADVCRLTDGPFVHVGGDEAVGATDESFAHSVRELRSLVRKSGKRPLGWQESSRAGVGPEDILQFWVDVPMMDLPDTADEIAARPELVAAGTTLEFVQALKSFFAPTDQDLARILDGGGRVLLSPQSHLYLDRAYAPEIVPAGREEDAARLGFPTYRPLGVEHTAAWDPASHGIPEDRVAGVEATVFAESVESLDDVTTLLLPRLASVAAAAWTGRAPDWTGHRARLAHHGRLWEQRGLAYLPSTEVPWATAHEG